MDSIEIGKSEVSGAFGAKTSVVMPDQGMYLVMGEAASPEEMIIGSGGSIVLRLSNLQVLAMLSFDTYLSFMRSRKISFIGPVSVDQQRFARFLSQFGISASLPDVSASA